MNYKCPYCGSDVIVKWWRAKSKIKCDNCHDYVFTSVKNKLQTMYFIVIFVVCFPVPLIVIKTNNIWRWEWVLYIILAGVSTSIISYILELMICQKLKK